MTTTVAVFGAYGHTGRFVVDELRRRGLVPLLCGRDAAKLTAFAAGYPDLDVRPATVEDDAALDQALAGAAAVINCAGPFATTAGPLVEAALRAGIPYVDVAAEVEAVLGTFANFAEPARAAGVVVVPGMAFYGGLGDLLITAALGERTAADVAYLAYDLSTWHPTVGTRNTMAVIHESAGGGRACFSDGRLQYRDGAPPMSKWAFPDPLGVREVIGEFNLADIATVPSHLSIPEVCGHLNVEAAVEVTTPDTPLPVAVDETGRSAQQFVVEAVVRIGATELRAAAHGQDAYAVSAPMAVEAVQRILGGQVPTGGVLSAGAAFDARDFLTSLSGHLRVDLPA